MYIHTYTQIYIHIYLYTIFEIFISILTAFILTCKFLESEPTLLLIPQILNTF